MATTDVSQYDGLLAQKKKLRRRAEIRKTVPLFLMMLPGLVYLFCNNYLPMFGILIAFKKVNFSIGILQSPWVGFQNFEFLFKTKDAWTMIRNTVCYNVVFITLGLVISVTIAIMMAEISSRKIAKVIQPIICFPSMVSAVILSFLVYGFLSNTYGFLNTTVLKDSPINWYASAQYWPFILTIVHFWQSSGQSSIIYMASIGGIDKGLYESARLDGANKMQQIWNITLPMLRPMIILMTLMSIGRIFNSDFGLFYQVTQGVPNSLYNVASTFDTFIFQNLRTNGMSIGQIAAAGLFQAVCCCATILLANFIVSKLDSDSAII